MGITDHLMASRGTCIQVRKPGNVSLVLATQEVVDGKREVGVDALEEVMMHIGTKL